MKFRKVEDVLRQLLRHTHPDYFMRSPSIAATNNEALKVIRASLDNDSNRAPRVEKIYLKPFADGANPEESFIRVASASETRRSVEELLRKFGYAPDETLNQPSFERSYCDSYSSTAGPELWDLAALFVKKRVDRNRPAFLPHNSLESEMNASPEGFGFGLSTPHFHVDSSSRGPSAPFL